MPDSSRIVFTDRPIVDQFPVFIGPGPACQSGLTDSDFQVQFFRNGEDYSVGFTIEEIGTTGQYAIGFQFSLPGFYEVQVYNTFNQETYYETYDVYPGADVAFDLNNPFIQRIFGLANHNVVTDQRTYDACGQVTGARVRLYDTNANAQSGGTTGLLFTYQISIEYVGPNQLKSFVQVLV